MSKEKRADDTELLVGEERNTSAGMIRYAIRRSVNLMRELQRENRQEELRATSNTLGYTIFNMMKHGHLDEILVEAARHQAQEQPGGGSDRGELRCQ